MGSSATSFVGRDEGDHADVDGDEDQQERDAEPVARSMVVVPTGERAGRAREFVMTAGRYDADAMYAWGVVNRLLPDDGFADAAVAYTRRLAEGPTLAHNTTKAVLRAYRDGGVAEADRIVPEAAGKLFQTDDLQRALQSFLTEGHGKATFHGR